MPDQPSSTPSPDAPSSGRGTAVVIEDDLILRTGMVDWLEGLGYQAGASSNGFSGLRHVRRVRPDVLVLDLVIPEISGPEVLAAVRQDPMTAETPVLVVTARADLLPAVGPRERLLQKPFNYDAFVQEVEALAAA